MAALTALTVALGALAIDRLDAPSLGLVALAPLLFACRRRRARTCFVAGTLAGSGIAAVALRFVPAVLLSARVVTAGQAWGALLALAVGHGLVFGVGLAAAAWARDRGASFGVVAAATITLLEIVVPIPLPFPFGAVLLASPIAQVADVVGASGLTLVTLAAAGVTSEVAAAIVRRGPVDGRGLVAGACIVVAAGIYGGARVAQLEGAMARAPRFSAALIQPARTRERAAPILSLLPPRGDERLDAILLPESTLSAEVPEGELEPLVARLFQGFDAPVIVGARERQKSGRAKNVALAVDPSGASRGRYEKRELVPFSEDDTEEGRDLPPLEVGGVRTAIAICYEDMHAGRVRERVNASEARLIVDIANDGWLSGTNAPELHLAAARLRAIELRRSVLRATNDGVTAGIDPLGRVVARAPTGVPARLRADVPLLEERTVFSRAGSLAILGPALALLVAGTLSRRRAD